MTSIERFDIYPRIRAVILNIGIMLGLYSCARLLFLILNWNLFAKYSTADIMYSFFVGLRFDLATITIISLPYVILQMLPLKNVDHGRYQLAMRALFVILNFPFFVINLVDIEYSKFTGARMTLAITKISADGIKQLPQFFVHYWHIASLGVLMFFIMWKIFRASNTRQTERTALVYSIPILLLTIILAGIAARGGLQKKPLQPSYAFNVAREDLALLALNSAFTVIKTNPQDNVQTISYYPSLQEATAKLQPPVFSYPGAPQKSNVVILILESYATEFWGAANKGEGYTPFMDTLAKKGLFFRNSFANGRRSIEALPAIMLGVPSLMELPLAKSKFQFNEWHGLGELLKPYGYSTSFFHGADLGTMYFDAVARLSGLDLYFSRNEYPNDKDYDGHWGIFDEPYLGYVVKEVSKFKEPFLTSVFTLSSHQPYPIPPQHQGKFKKGPTALHESIGYVDYALQQFFEAAAKEPWFKNTLFIVTGDHTQMSLSVNYGTTFGRHMVPLLLYHPGVTLAADTTKTVQHTDILPTVLDFLRIPQPKLTLFGHSVWQAGEGRAVYQQNGIYTLVARERAVQLNSGKDTFEHFCFTDPNAAKRCELNPEDAKKLEGELKAYVQYFNNGLNDNQLYKW